MENQQKTREQIEQELLNAVEKAQRELQQCCGTGRGAAITKYRLALKRFNDFVIDGKIPEEQT